MHRDEWARSINRHPATVKRWQDKGDVVVRYLGRDPFVDIPATTALMRGETKPNPSKTRRKAK
jgi:hypothetical protein